MIKDDAQVTIECAACGFKVVMTYAEFKDIVPVIKDRFLMASRFQCVECLNMAEVSVGSG